MSRPPPQDHPPPIDPERLRTFFARASVVAHLLRSRLALPLLYPLNTQSFANQPDKHNPIASARWDAKTVARTLSHMTPAIIGMSRMVHLLKAGHALAHYRGGVKRHMYVLKKRKPGQHRLHFVRPHVWNYLKPGDEHRTKHLKWRYGEPQ
ncbi:unnamed protein product [Vitrella brassicaformis CCMP3155]|uniref:Uncharacterized protein n=2 Tax=Vitrella brassicaformis TaxID=1169539 RepID=A0A0G4FLM0_VITBC|nr:unnamed protein product [Vitrella brassicaformis CCMP3155]|mmetsp:Transcript_28226/g.70539  ORF Transcript_28226/g.70539 Transcript_28226/m.70539 type:complete len:151 (+) Transcript_28226:166-618(+)|eukprot:CEM14672.1 unnamed protein product [Vitrella brassicaformis CCMP3155]